MNQCGLKAKQVITLIHMCVCYRPPNAKAEFLTKLQDSLDLVKQSGAVNIILAGCLNADPGAREGHILYLFTLSNNLCCHIDEPTMVTATSAIILDQFMYNMP